MLVKLKSFINRLKNRLDHTDSIAPVPVVVRRNVPPAHRSKAAGAAQPDSANTSAKAAPRAQIISRGNNKNVYVTMAEGEDENDVLRNIDSGDEKTTDRLTVQKPAGGFDPYNSGVFDKSRVWGARD